MKASPPAKDVKAVKARACPICGRPRDEKYTPFCSRRCADVDLYRWLNGNYAIPGGDEPDEGRRDARGEEEEM
jgi:hypothetical protein